MTNILVPRYCSRPTWLLRVAMPLLFLITTFRTFSSAPPHSIKLHKLGNIRQNTSHAKLHVLLWTQTRSGSRLTMQLLTVAPGSFVMEEPLRNHENIGFHNAARFLQDILKCRLSRRPDYFKHLLSITLEEPNELTFLCKHETSLCRYKPLTVELCKAARINLAKVAAVELGVAGPLLTDSDLNVKIVHLVRDPRAVVASRLKTQKDFGGLVLGPGIYQEEKNLTRVCSRYQQDLTAARSLLKHSPQRYTLVRYEDLALHPQQEVRRLYNFLDLPYTALVANKVASHTLGFLKDIMLQYHPFSTSKNSSATVFAWRHRLNFAEVTRLQQECGAVLKGYGYRTYPTPRHYHDPHSTPLLPLPRPS